MRRSSIELDTHEAAIREILWHLGFGRCSMGRNQFLVQIRLFMFAAVTFLAIANTATAIAKPNSKVLAAAKACEPSARSLLQQLVQIDSGTGDVAGLSAMGGILKTELEGLGASVEIVPAVGDNLVATLTGAGRGRILLIAHMDTVFAHGTVTQRPYAVVGDHGIGPGAGDDKGGDVTAICALRILQQLNYRDYGRITLLLNSNEETGSLGTRELIRTKAKESDVAINLERGVPPDGVLVARKGSAIITVEITGRAAHSGLEPEKGRNAALEASHQALELGSLSDPLKETTVNVTMLEGGKTINVIPDHAAIKADVRAFTSDEFDRVERDLQKLAANTIIPDVQVRATMTRNFPPWPHVDSTDALFARAQKLYAELGGTLSPIAVGSSADVAFAAETGTPSIDGFGMRGGGAHSVDDYADLSSIAPRVYLLTRMLMDLGHNPAVKPMGH
jgi:glutamate carboxypeptidase